MVLPGHVFDELSEALIPSLILDELLVEKLITKAECEDIKRCLTPAEKSRKLLRSLVSRRKEDYLVFRRILENTPGCENAYVILLSSEERVLGVRKWTFLHLVSHSLTY